MIWVSLVANQRGHFLAKTFHLPAMLRGHSAKIPRQGKARLISIVQCLGWKLHGCLMSIEPAFEVRRESWRIHLLRISGTWSKDIESLYSVGVEWKMQFSDSDSMNSLLVVLYIIEGRNMPPLTYQQPTSDRGHGAWLCRRPGSSGFSQAIDCFTVWLRFTLALGIYGAAFTLGQFWSTVKVLWLVEKTCAESRIALGDVNLLKQVKSSNF